MVYRVEYTLAVVVEANDAVEADKKARKALNLGSVAFENIIGVQSTPAVKETT